MRRVSLGILVGYDVKENAMKCCLLRTAGDCRLGVVKDGLLAKVEMRSCSDGGARG